MIFNLLFIPEIILSIGVMIIIVIDLFLQSHKGITFKFIQLLLLLSGYYSVNGQVSSIYQSYELSEFLNVIKLILLFGSFIIFH